MIGGTPISGNLHFNLFESFHPIYPVFRAGHVAVSRQWNPIARSCSQWSPCNGRVAVGEGCWGAHRRLQRWRSQAEGILHGSQWYQYQQSTVVGWDSQRYGVNLILNDRQHDKIIKNAWDIWAFENSGIKHSWWDWWVDMIRIQIFPK